MISQFYGGGVSSAVIRTEDSPSLLNGRKEDLDMWRMKCFEHYVILPPVEEQVAEFLNKENLDPGQVKIIGFPPTRATEKLSSAIVFYYGAKADNTS